jgi:hypothetical protein
VSVARDVTPTNSPPDVAHCRQALPGGFMTKIENESVTLLDKEMDGTKVFVEVYVSSTSGDVVMAGQDIGSAPLQSFGEDEYEYFLSVPAEQKDRLILQLMHHVFAGNEQTRTAIAEWLDERGIPYSLHSF